MTFNENEITVGNWFMGNTFGPFEPYQRGFEIKDEIVQRIIKDIISISNINKEGYYHSFQKFKYYRETPSSELDIVDGLQRTICLMLFFAKVKNELEKRKKYPELVDLCNQYIYKTNTDNNGNVQKVPRLRLQSMYNTVFKSLLETNDNVVQKNIISNKEPSEIKKLQYVNDEIIENIKNVSDEDLKKIAAALMNKLTLEHSTTDDIDEAKNINSKENTLRTTQSDKHELRSTFIDIFSDHEFNIKIGTKWDNELISNISNEESSIFKFFHLYCISKGFSIDYGNKAIIRWFRNTNSNLNTSRTDEKDSDKQNLENLIEEIILYSSYYKLFNGGDLMPEVNLSSLNKIANNSTFYYSPLFILWNHYNNGKITKEIFIKSYKNIRNVVIVQGFIGRQQSLRDFYISISSKLQNIEYIDDVNKILNEKWNDGYDKSKDYAKQYNMKNTKVQMGILEMLSKWLDGNVRKIETIEHIAPQKRDENWKHIPEDRYKIILNKLGNLTPLTKSENSSITKGNGKKESRSKIEKKMVVYGNSTFRLTSSLVRPINTGTIDTRCDVANKLFNYISPLKFDETIKWDEEKINLRTDSMVNLLFDYIKDEVKQYD